LHHLLLHHRWLLLHHCRTLLLVEVHTKRLIMLGLSLGKAVREWVKRLCLWLECLMLLGLWACRLRVGEEIQQIRLGFLCVVEELIHRNASA